MRVLGLDVGDKNIGLAISDETRTIAFGLDVIKKTADLKHVIELESIVKEKNITKIVVGMPINMDGTLGLQGKKTTTFINQLKKIFEIPIITWDERFTTKIAEKALIEADISRKKRKRLIDKVSAINILQNYLDYQKAVD